MAENADAARRYGAKQPRRLIRRRSERGVGRGHHNIELAKFVRFHVDRSVRTDIRLNSLQQPKAAMLLRVQPIDLSMLLGGFGH